MILNTTSCIYAQNSVQNTSPFIYIYAETKISGIETIHIATNVLKKESNNIEVNNNVIFNSCQIYVSQNAFIYYNSFESSLYKTISSASNTFQNKKTVNYFNIKKFDAKKSNPKATTKYKAIPPFNNSPFGLYANGFNKIAVSTTNPSLNKKKELSFLYILPTKIVEPLTSTATTIFNQEDIYSIENHFLKYTFSLPPPVLC